MSARRAHEVRPRLEHGHRVAPVVAPIAALVVALGGACGGSPPPPAPAPTPTPPIADALAGRPLEPVRSRRFDLTLVLPDRPGFAIDDAPPSTWLRATHPASRSLVLVKRWRAQGPASPEKCRAEAALTLPVSALPDAARGAPLEVRTWRGPAGFRTEVETWALGPASASPDAAARGWLTAFGADGRRCFAFVFATETTGPGRERRLAERLAALEGTLPRLELSSELEGAPTRERLPTEVPRDER